MVIQIKNHLDYNVVINLQNQKTKEQIQKENYENLENESAAQLQARFKNLISDNLFSVDSLKGGLSSKGGVISRLSKSIEIFS